MINIDEQEEKIIRELVKNPRISDNSISKNTKVPVMTVNRKRKRLEENGTISYFVSVNTGEDGTGLFYAKQMYIIKFKIGLTQKEYTEKMEKSKARPMFAEHVEFSFLGEKDGHLASIMAIAARTESDLMEIFNGKIIPLLKDNFGEDSIKEVITTKISNARRLHHNYLPGTNMANGKIEKAWSNDWIFTGKHIE